MAKVGEKLVCRSLGIIRDGEDVTVDTLDKFTGKFKDQLSVEDALIDHGGEGATELGADQDGALGSQPTEA